MCEVIRGFSMGLLFGYVCYVCAEESRLSVYWGLFHLQDCRIKSSDHSPELSGWGNCPGQQQTRQRSQDKSRIHEGVIGIQVHEVMFRAKIWVTHYVDGEQRIIWQEAENRPGIVHSQGQRHKTLDILTMFECRAGVHKWYSWKQTTANRSRRGRTQELHEAWKE